MENKEKNTAPEVPVQEQQSKVSVVKTYNIHGMEVKIKFIANFDQSILDKPKKIFTSEIVDVCKTLSEELIDKVDTVLT